MLRSGCSREEDGLEEHLVRTLPGRGELGGAAGGALEAAPAAANERAGVEVALAGAGPDAAEHVFKELVREREVDGAAFRAQGAEVRGTLAPAP